MSYFALYSEGTTQYFNKDQYYICWELLNNLLSSGNKSSLHYVPSVTDIHETCCYLRVDESNVLNEYTSIGIEPMNSFLEKASAFTGCFPVNSVAIGDDVQAMYDVKGKLHWLCSQKLFVLERFMKYEFSEWIKKNGWYRNASK